MNEPMPKKETAEAKRTSKRRGQEELYKKRTSQLSDARKVLQTLESQLQTKYSKMRQHDALSNHSKGFYHEIDKLAKGKHLIEATDLIMERANDIIRDAKKIVEADVFLDRIKEFVAAGNNPVYPDVLVSIRSVLDSLERYRKELSAEAEAPRTKIRRAETVIGALEYFLDDENDSDVEEKNYPARDDIKNYVRGPESDFCFSQNDDGYEHFDFERLDLRTVTEYLSMSEDDEDQGFAEGETPISNREEAEQGDSEA